MIKHALPPGSWVWLLILVPFAVGLHLRSAPQRMRNEPIPPDSQLTSGKMYKHHVPTDIIITDLYVFYRCLSTSYRYHIYMWVLCVFYRCLSMVFTLLDCPKRVFGSCSKLEVALVSLVRSRRKKQDMFRSHKDTFCISGKDNYCNW